MRPRSGLNFTPALRLVVVGLLYCFASIPESPAEPACLLSIGIWGRFWVVGVAAIGRLAGILPHTLLSPYVRACTALYCTTVLTEY